MVEAVGAGSVWNQNSWHWEEKNYTVQAKAFLTEHLAKIEFDAPEPASSVKLYETKSVEGSCSITIRKGKQIVLFDFSMDAYFKATSKTDEEETKSLKPENALRNSPFNRFCNAPRIGSKKKIC